MALDYRLYLTTDNSPEDIHQDILSRFSLDQVRENLIKGTGVLISVHDINPRSQDYYEEEVGIRPTISLLFILDKSDSRVTGRRLMTQICVHRLEMEKGDAMFIQHGNVLLFIRKSGVLTLNADTDWWDAEMLALLPMQWQKGKLPVV